MNDRSRSPSSLSSCSSAPSGSGKSTFARAALPADRGAVVRLLPRPGLRRRERPGRDRATPSTCCTSSPRKRLAAGRLTVVDATNVQPEARKPLVALAREHHVPAGRDRLRPARERSATSATATRPDRDFGAARRPPASAAAAPLAARPRARGLPPRLRASSRPRRSTRPTIERQPLWNDRRDEHGPFDIIGDVHGCFAELDALLDASSATRSTRTTAGDRVASRRAARRSSSAISSTAARTIPGVLRLVMAMVGGGHRALRARQPRREAAAQAARAATSRSPTASPSRSRSSNGEPPEFRERGRRRSSTASSATTCSTTASSSSRTPGMKEEMQGRGSGAVRDFALYGETTGETDEFGLPVRYNWAAEYRGRGDGRLRPHAGARAGVAEPHDQHRHRLRLRRQADRAALSRARARLGAGARDLRRAGPAVPAQPTAPALTAQQEHDDVLDLDDVLGKRHRRRPACAATSRSARRTPPPRSR